MKHDPASHLLVTGQAGEIARLAAERDAAREEAARLREALSGAHMDLTEAYDMLEGEGILVSEAQRAAQARYGDALILPAAALAANGGA